MKKVLISLCACALLFVACSDNDEEENGPTGAAADSSIGESEINAADSIEFKTMIDGGASKTWMAEEFTLAGLTTFTSCRLDDEMVLHADGTYMYNGGSNLCGAEDNQQFKSGTWELDYGNTMLTFDAGTDNEESALVIGLNENEIRLDGSYMLMQVRGVYTVGE